ncbi:hypothetical protein QUB68_24015 [Microcoleus sp. A006_D1]|uniref:hypothetical protein n=1 Tax=Microcoleus sp. A006_D1 TaxID=3055267 RepID=UPI002FCF815D
MVIEELDTAVLCDRQFGNYQLHHTINLELGAPRLRIESGYLELSFARSGKHDSGLQQKF